MFGKKKEARPPRSRENKNLSQYGLFEVDTNFNGTDNMNFDDDDDLEAELLALTSDSGNARPKAPPRRPQAPKFNINISHDMKDIPSDEELSGDDDDPDLLNELNEIAGITDTESMPTVPTPTQDSALDLVQLLDDRLKMYITAELNAKEAGETTRARRFNRGVKSLKDLIKQNNSGKSINSEDIPPEVTVNVQKRDPPEEPPPDYAEPSATNDNTPDNPPPTSEPTGTPTAPSTVDENLLKLLTDRRDQYKLAALQAKRTGDAPLALNHIKVAKQFEHVIKAVQNGQPVDVSLMPGPPSNNVTAIGVVVAPQKEESEVQTQSADDTPANTTVEELPQENLVTASSAAEALEQRLEVYKNQEKAASDQGNSSKARRMGRIVKQFEQAIKLNKAGKPVPFDDLPTPPGFAPIPGAPPPAAPPSVAPPEPAAPAAPRPAPPIPGQVAGGGGGATPKSPAAAAAGSARTSGNRLVSTHADRQVALLLARQREFKEAALNAKKRGEMAQAKEFLRSAKGFDPLIGAAQGGMPVDIASLPLPPTSQSKLEDEYSVVMAEECTEEDQDLVDIITRFEAQLTKQLKMCMTTRDHYKALGDVASAHRFENLAMGVTKDLDVIRIAKRTSCAAPPRFHYETKSFSIVKSFTELNDNDFEMVLLRGINYNCANPKEIDTYVKYEFPFPQEEPVVDKTATFKDNNNPEYNHTVIFPIQRTARPCQRVFKRHSLKLEVYSKGSFFRSDTLLGTVQIKLQPLETQCEIHDSFDLLDGRKKTGGKLEVQLRLRNPLLSKEVQQITEKWLVLDHN